MGAAAIKDAAPKRTKREDWKNWMALDIARNIRYEPQVRKTRKKNKLTYHFSECFVNLLILKIDF